MHRDTDEEVRHIQKKLILINILGTPGAILLGLGLYALFEGRGDAFIDILNDKNTVYGFIVVGALIMLWEMVTMVSLHKRKSELREKKTGSNGNLY